MKFQNTSRNNKNPKMAFVYHSPVTNAVREDVNTEGMQRFDLPGNQTLHINPNPFTHGQYATIHDAVLLRAGSDDDSPRNVIVKIMGSEYSLSHSRMETAIHFIASRCTVNGIPGAPVLYTTFMWNPRHFAVAMQKMDGNLYRLLRNTPNALRRAKLAKRALKHVSRFLKVMQTKYQFMHRDLHGSNVLYVLDDGHSARTAPVSKFTFYVADFGNACTKRLHCPVDGKYISDIQRHTQFTRFNPGLDLNTLILSIRPFLSTQMREVPIMRQVVQHFFKEATRHSAYTCDAKRTLEESAGELGMNIHELPFLEGDVPLFWFSYAAACQLRLPYTEP